MARFHKPKPPIPRRKAIGLTVGAFVLGTGGGISIYPHIPFPALVGFAVIGIGIIVMLGFAMYPPRRL